MKKSPCSIGRMVLILRLHGLPVAQAGDHNQLQKSSCCSQPPGLCGQCVSVSDGKGFYHDGHAGVDIVHKNFTHLANLVASVM